MYFLLFVADSFRVIDYFLYNPVSFKWYGVDLVKLLYFYFFFTLATSSGNCNVMAWRPSVRLYVPFAYSP